MSPIKHIPKTKEDWLQSRKEHINASEIGVIVGVNKYGSIVDIYLNKIGEKEQTEETTATMWGHAFEDGVAQIFEQTTGIEVIQSTKGDWQYISSEDTWMACSPDRLVWKKGATKNVKDHSQKALLECKTTTQDPEKEDNKWMLQSWYAQVQWQMMVSQIDEAYLFCCVLNHERKTVLREWKANKEFQEKLKEIAWDFWFNNVKARKAPQPITESDVKKLFPTQEKGKTQEATEEVQEAIKELQKLQEEKKHIEEREQTLKDAITTAIADAETLTVKGSKLATYKEQITTRVDTKRIKEEEPAIYDKYNVQISTRVLRINK